MILTICKGAIIAYFRIAKLQPLNHLTQPQAELFTLPFWLLFNALWARFIVINYEIPRVGGFRLAVGLLALVFMLCAELIGGIIMYEEGWQEWVWETDPLVASMGALALLLFGLMPLLMMAFEAETDEMGATYHGHENKPIHAAV